MAARIAPGRVRVGYYRIHFLESIRPEGIVCLECGQLYKALGTHLRRQHHMELDDYRESWGFNRNRAFVAADTAARLRRWALKRNLGAAGSGEKLAKARAARTWPRIMRPEARLKLSEQKKALYASGWQPPRHRKVNDRTLRRLAREDDDLQRIARKAGLSRDQTRLRLQALGLLPPRRRRRLVNRERILALRRQGLWPLEIARQMQLKVQVVRKILWSLRGQGIPVPTPSRPRPIKNRVATDAEFLSAFRRGGTIDGIAARLGVSRLYVHKTYRLRRRGLIAPARAKRRDRAPRQGHRSP
jgi:hypothetical protein